MNKHYSPIHSNNFTNHLSMYEQALRRLNIDDKLIKERCLDYVNSRPLRDINDKSISLSKKEEKYLERYQYYVKQTQPLEDFLRPLLKDTYPSLDAHLFHGLIRLAFAVDNPDQDEMAKALAFWDTLSHAEEDFHVYTVNVTPKKSSTVPKEDFKHLMDLRSSLDFNLGDLSISEKLEKFINTPKLTDAITNLVIEDDIEKRIGFTLGLWFLITRDFVVLHIVNAFNALTRLKPYIDNYNQWLQTFWIKAQVYSLISDERLPVIKIEIKSWDEIMDEVHAASEVHDIKLIYACKELSERLNLVIFNKIAHIVSHKYWLHQ